MSKIVLSNVTSNGTLVTAASNINNNSVLVESAFENTLSRDGTSPNEMNADLDMNSNQIINLPAPLSLNSPARLADVMDLTGPPGPPGPPGPSSGIVNINSLTSSPLVSDGVTSNVPMLQSLVPVLYGVGSDMPVPVNITVGNPTVLSINPTVSSGGTLPNPTIHWLKPNQSFYFTISPGGSLPNGISLNTPYYIKAGTQGVDGMTATTFTFSTTNNYDYNQIEGSAVATTGSLSGTASIVLTGKNLNLFIPPGPYFGGNYGDITPNVYITPNGISRVRYFGYGAVFDTKTTWGPPSSAIAGMRDAKTWAIGYYDYVNTTPNELVVAQLDAQVTLATTANAVNYYVGQWVSFFGLNIQDGFNNPVSGPPNCHYQEFKRIKAIDTNTGIITFDGPLRWIYLSTFPKMFTPTSIFVASGAAAIVPMHPSWDTEIEVRGVKMVGQAAESSCRRFTYTDCVFEGYGNSAAQGSPSSSQVFVYKNCRFGPSGAPGLTYMEVDKMMEYLELDGCYTPNKYYILCPSPSLKEMVVKSHQGSKILGTPRSIRVADSQINALFVGPVIGVTDRAVVYNSGLSYFDMQQRNDDSQFISPTNDMTLVPNWSFSNGTFTRNLTGTNQGMLWAIPGAKMYMTDAGNVYSFGQNMGSPFTILNTYMDGSGNFSFDTTLSAVPTRQTSHTATITIASPGVVTWASHGLAAGTPVVFTTTGALPTGLSVSKAYYVTNDGNLATNTFAVSDTLAHANAGTGQINTSGSQSGTHTAFGNPLCFRPHPCPRFTSIGNSGCNTIIDQNGSVDEPLFSRVKRAFVGKQSNLGGNSAGFQIPLPKIWGFLKSMTVNVRKAGTASGTLTISCPGFTQPNLTLSTFSQVIDTTVAGVRSWAGSAAPTGSAGADSIAAYADWIAGPLVFTWSTGVTLPNSPVVEFEIFTDQGITKFSNMMGAPGTPAAGFNLWQYIDSGILEQYGSSP